MAKKPTKTTLKIAVSENDALDAFLRTPPPKKPKIEIAPLAVVPAIKKKAGK